MRIAWAIWPSGISPRRGRARVSATWRGVLYVGFVIDVLTHRIISGRVSASVATNFVRETLEQNNLALRRDDNPLVHHDDLDERAPTPGSGPGQRLHESPCPYVATVIPEPDSYVR